MTQEAFVYLFIPVAEYIEYHPGYGTSLIQVFFYRIHCDLSGLVLRESENPCGNAAESYACEPLLFRCFKAGLVAGCQIVLIIFG